MKARPILMSAPMVRPLLAVSKTQTRRTKGLEYFSENDPDGWRCARVRDGVAYMVYKNSPIEREARCPYGAVLDLLYVREAFQLVGGGDPGIPIYRANWREDAIARGLENVPTSDPKGWKPGIHMPRSVSRLTLKLTDVRVERLQQISEDDAIAEGIEREGDGWRSYEIIREGRYKGERHPHAVVPNRSPVTSYRELWEAINGPQSWAANPWCWRLQFECIQKNVDEISEDPNDRAH